MAAGPRTLLGDHERRFGKAAWGIRAVFALLFIGTLTTLYPLIWLTGNAFKSPEDYKSTPLSVSPTQISPVSVEAETNSGPGKVNVEAGEGEIDPETELQVTFLSAREVAITSAASGEVWAGTLDGDTDLEIAGIIIKFRGQFAPGDTHHIEMRAWHSENYAEAWEGVRFVRHSINTAILMICIWFMHLAVNALAAYALSRLPFPGSKFVQLLFLMTLMVPWFAIFIPLYLTVTNLGLTVPMYGWPAVIIPAGFNAFFLILFKSFFDGLPGDLIDAARIDGAGELQTFWNVAVPLAKPIFAVITVFSLLATWNDFLWPYLVIANENGEPLMVRLYNFENTGAPTEWVLAALAMAMVPPIVLFIIFQRQIAAGFTLSGLKG